MFVTVSIIPDDLFMVIFDSMEECSELHCWDTETLMLCFYKGFIKRVCVFYLILRGGVTFTYLCAVLWACFHLISIKYQCNLSMTLHNEVWRIWIQCTRCVNKMVTTWLYRENSLFISLSLRCNMKGKTPKTELQVKWREMRVHMDTLPSGGRWRLKRPS